MCVAVYKPAGVPAPSMDTLKSCWLHNPDGAGIGYTTANGKFAIVKGFMKWKNFEKKVESLGDLTNAQVFYHFRIATHGSIRPGNCHPFPISTSLKQLQATSGVYDRVLMHNGILPITPVLKDTSDSQELARRLAAFKTDQQFKNALDLLEGFEDGSKIAVWANGKVELFGNWTPVNGVYYSNMLWSGTPRYLGRVDDSHFWNSAYWTIGGKNTGEKSCGYNTCGYGSYDYDDDDASSEREEAYAQIFSQDLEQEQDRKTLYVTAKPDEATLIKTYGICPVCENELEEVNMTDTEAYCEHCDIEWNGDFK